MAEETTNETGSETPETPPAAESPAEKPGFELRPERIVDITLGMGVLAGETIERAARRLWDDAPTFFGEVEEKGRPIREQLTGFFRSAVPSVTETFAGASAPVSHEDEIAALERRARELEQKVAPGAGETDVPAAAAHIELDEAPAPTPDPVAADESAEGGKGKKRRGVPLADESAEAAIERLEQGGGEE